MACSPRRSCLKRGFQPAGHRFESLLRHHGRGPAIACSWLCRAAPRSAEPDAETLSGHDQPHELAQIAHLCPTTCPTSRPARRGSRLALLPPAAARSAKGSQRQSAVQGTCSRFARNATSLVAARREPSSRILRDPAANPTPPGAASHSDHPDRMKTRHPVTGRLAECRAFRRTADSSGRWTRPRRPRRGRAEAA